MKRLHLLLLLPLPLPAPAPPRAPLLLVRPVLGKAFGARPLSAGGNRLVFLGKKGRRIVLDASAVEEILPGRPGPRPPRGPFLFLPGGESLPVEAIRSGRKGGVVPLVRGTRIGEIPLDEIAGFQWPRRPRRGMPETLKELDPSKRPSGRDLLFLVKDKGKILEVAVTVLGLARGGLRFQFAGKERTVPLWRVAGLLLGKAPGEERADRPRPNQSVEFERGGYLLGKIPAWDSRGIRFLHPLLGEMRFSWKDLFRLRPSLDRRRELASLELLSDRAVPAFDRVWPLRRDRNLEGGPIRIHGTYFEKGFVFLPERSLTFPVPRGFRLFRAVLGIEDSGGGRGAAVFRIRAGGKVVFEETIRAGRDPRDVVLDLGKARTLTLQADFGPELDLGDHCVFARPRLLLPPPGKEDAP